MQVKTQDAKKIIGETAEKVCEIYKVEANKKAIEEFLDCWETKIDKYIDITIAEKVVETFYLKITLFSSGGNHIDVNTFLGHTDKVIDELKKADLNFYRDIDRPMDTRTFGHTLRISIH